jgi:hypothetical protein
MGLAIRVRVTWDRTVIEDRVHFGALRIGAGPLAHTAAPGRKGAYVTLTPKGRGFELRVEPGAAHAVEFPGEPRIELTGLDSPWCKQLDPPFGSGQLVIAGDVGDTIIEFERLGMTAGQPAPRDYVLFAWVAVAMVLALGLGGTYTLTRVFGDGQKPQWGRALALNEHDASMVRVRIGPDGAGASRPQAGRGIALHGTSQGKRPLAVEHPDPPQVPTPQVAARNPKRSGKRGAPVPVNGPVGNVEPQVKGVVDPQENAPPAKEAPRPQLLEDAQAALLAADLRKAIDSFSHAARTAPLDYDQLNWLGLAHYLTGEYKDAEETWAQARALDPSRPDAINNLASVAKRRGDTSRELEYLNAALALQPADCHASNSLALAQAKSKSKDALDTLQRSDGNCGGNYAYTAIQKAAILALSGDRDGAFKELETGLSRVDTLIPIKEFEVLTDLKLDPAFSSLRSDTRFAQLVTKYLPRAAGWKDAPVLNGEGKL